MKKILPVLLVIAILILAFSLFSSEFSFVGAGKCKMCHKSEKQGKQYPLWEAFKHSQSYSALLSDAAKDIAKEEGLDSAPNESEKCLNCHGPLHAKAPEFKEEGVTCEVCHGPGSAYKKMSIMKDHAESVKNGMTEYASPDDIKEFCLGCHDNAHGKSFDFAVAWEKLKHPVPEK